MPHEQVGLISTAVSATATPVAYRSVQEVHVDFLLEEEFIVNREFGRLFLTACHPSLNFRTLDVLQVTRSHLCRHGEIDLRVELSAVDACGTAHRLVLLIENKIGASFQPAQAERYGLAGHEEELGHGLTAVTVLVAPARYVARGHRFMCALSYEEIGEWFCPNDSDRRDAKIAVLQVAITRSATQRVQKPDTTMTAFRAAYYDHLQHYNARQGTDFSMRLPTVTYVGDTWFEMRSKSLPDWIRFRHMAPTGYVEISFRNTDLDKAEPFLRRYMPGDFTLTCTGKYHQHTTIRRPISRIVEFDNYEKARPIVETSLAHMERLLRLAVDNRPQLEAGLVPLRRTKGGVPLPIEPALAVPETLPDPSDS